MTEQTAVYFAKGLPYPLPPPPQPRCRFCRDTGCLACAEPLTISRSLHQRGRIEEALELIDEHLADIRLAQRGLRAFSGLNRRNDGGFVSVLIRE